MVFTGLPLHDVKNRKILFLTRIHTQLIHIYELFESDLYVADLASFRSSIDSITFTIDIRFASDQ